jgi:hypothetical protein
MESLPPTLTQLRIRAESNLLPSFHQLLPSSLTRLSLAGSLTLIPELLPLTITHLTIRYIPGFDSDVFAKLPKTLTNLTVTGMDSIAPNFWTSQLASVLPNLVTLRLGSDDQSPSIGSDWVLPPRLTHLESRYGRFSWENPPHNFFGLKRIHFFDAELSELFLVQIPTSVVSIKVGKIKLHGITTKDDSSLTHLSGHIIIDHFDQWKAQQRTLYGRVIYCVQTCIGEICALPPNIQTISRKLRLKPLTLHMVDCSPSSKPYIYDPVEMMEIPCLMKSLNAFTLELSETAISAIFEDLTQRGNVKSLALPHDIVKYAGSYCQPALDGFRIRHAFSDSCLMKLPESLTKLTFAKDFVLQTRNDSPFWRMDNLLELAVVSPSVVSRLWDRWEGSFPSLVELSIVFLPLLNQFGLSNLPSTLKTLNILFNFECLPSWPGDPLRFVGSKLFKSLPAGLLSLSILHPCNLNEEDLASLPRSLTHFFCNSTGLHLQIPQLDPTGATRAYYSLPPGLVSLTCRAARSSKHFDAPTRPVVRQ